MDLKATIVFLLIYFLFNALYISKMINVHNSYEY